MATQSQVVTTQAQSMMAQANWEIETSMNKNCSKMDSHLRDFTRMNPLMFYGSKVNEDPQYFIDQVYKILLTMGVTSNEKFEQSTYKLKDVAQIWYTQWKENRAFRECPISWEILGRMNIPKGENRDKS